MPSVTIFPTWTLCPKWSFQIVIEVPQGMGGQEGGAGKNVILSENPSHPQKHSLTELGLAGQRGSVRDADWGSPPSH